MTEREWVETTRFASGDLCRFTLRGDRNPIVGHVDEFTMEHDELGLVIRTAVATFTEIPFEQIERIEVNE